MRSFQRTGSRSFRDPIKIALSSCSMVEWIHSTHVCVESIYRRKVRNICPLYSTKSLKKLEFSLEDEPCLSEGLYDVLASKYILLDLIYNEVVQI